MRVNSSFARLVIAALCAVAIAACAQRGSGMLPAFGSGFGSMLSSSGPAWTPIGPTEPKPGMLWWWNPIRDGNSGKFNAVAMNPRKPKVVYVAAGVGHGCEVISDAGIFKTIDGGATWAPIDNGLTDTYVNDIWIDPKRPNRLVAATELSGLFYTRNAGATWLPALTPVTAIALASTANGTIYAGTSAGLYSSPNGRTWTPVTSIPSTTVTALGVSGNVLYVGTSTGAIYTQAKSGAAFQPGGTIPTRLCNGSTDSSGSDSYGGTETSGIGEIAIDPREPAQQSDRRHAAALRFPERLGRRADRRGIRSRGVVDAAVHDHDG